MGKISYLEKKEQANRLFSSVFYNLERIIISLEVVGNEGLANKIREELDRMEWACDLYTQGFSEMFDNAYQASVQSSSNMVKAALAAAMNMPVEKE
jgi:hypothetical protein